VNGPLPQNSAERKTYPLYSGVLRYFPAALATVAHHSYLGNEKHNPGQELHWARGKSDDHLDAAARHLLEGDLPGAAWRILAALQLEEEGRGAPVAPGAKSAEAEPSALDRYLASGAVQEDARLPPNWVRRDAPDGVQTVALDVDWPAPGDEADDATATETPTVEFEADPVLQALIERGDEEAPLDGLTAGKAHMAEFGANPVSQRGEE